MQRNQVSLYISLLNDTHNTETILYYATIQKQLKSHINIVYRPNDDGNTVHPL